ncbi:MAG TPA: hypothetical protein VMU51_29935 [Mycobacteriales bacterium]|nr:hypothetical protein [Mycobacteriales bacterium]
MDEPATVTEPTGTTDAGQPGRERWSAPRLTQLDAAATGSGGFSVVDGADTLSMS